MNFGLKNINEFTSSLPLVYVVGGEFVELVWKGEVNSNSNKIFLRFDSCHPK